MVIGILSHININRIYIYIYIYIPHILLLHILYIQVRTLNYINCIFKRNTIPYSHFPHVMSPLCIYSYTFWNILTVLSNIILPTILLSPRYITNYPVYKHTNWTVLTVLLTVILSYNHVFPTLSCSVSCICIYTFWY